MDTHYASVRNSLSLVNISETERDRAMVAVQRKLKVGVSDSEAAIRFAAESTPILPFWMFHREQLTIVLPLRPITDDILFSLAFLLRTTIFYFISILRPPLI